MSIHEFITQDEIDEAPDDPRMAFARLVEIADRRLLERIGNLPNGDPEYSDQRVTELRYDFVTVISGLAAAYRIEGLDISRPSYGNFDNYTYKHIKADLDHYLTQLAVQGSLQRKRDSILIPPTVKDRLRSYIHGLKTEIDKANLSEAKRARLHEKLAEFEAELEKPRLNLMAVTTLVVTFLGAPGAIWASVELVQKLTTNILQTVGEAKAVDDENRRLPPTEKPLALQPPRVNEGTFNRELDDEIPF